jgi:hypothetical protein
MQFLAQQKPIGQVLYNVIKDIPGIGAAFVSLCQETWAKDTWGFSPRGR